MRVSTAMDTPGKLHVWKEGEEGLI